jgi:hypothetical protein
MSKFLTAATCLILVFLLTGCGNEVVLQSIDVTPTSPNVVGIGGTQQFTVTAHYSNSKSTDVTSRATYTIAAPTNGTSQTFTPLSALQINNNGLLEVVQGACTWTQTTVTPPGGTPSTVFGTSPYVMTVSFGGQQTTSFISVAAIAGCKFQ